MGFSAPKPAIPSIPPAAHPAVLGSQMSLVAQNVKSKAASSEGLGVDNTIKTSSEGLETPPSTAKVTLLGQ